MTTDPKIIARLWALKELNISASFLKFIEANLILGKCTEEEVLNYCIEKENKSQAGDFYAKPKTGYSKVPSRSVRKTQFWYAK